MPKGDESHEILRAQNVSIIVENRHQFISIIYKLPRIFKLIDLIIDNFIWKVRALANILSDYSNVKLH